MVPIASAQSSAVGSPASPGPKSTATSPADTGSSPQSSTTWSIQTRPATVRRFPASHTGPRLDACRGTPSPYPSGTTANVVSSEVVYVCPYDTPSPAGTRLVTRTLARTVIAGRSPKPAPGIGDSP